MDPRIVRSRTAALEAARTVALTEGLLAVTHSRIAEVSGVARRTLYRHWPSSHELLHDALATASFPTYARTGDLAADVRAHLRQLREALEHGPLASILLMLGERAAVDPSMASLRARLVQDGCRPLRALLGEHGVAAVDLDDAVDELEGPVFSSALLHARPASDALLERLVARAVERAASPA